MKDLQYHINEQQAATAFTKQSTVFDAQYANDAIIQYKRNRVRAHILQYLKPHSSILELNCGTGEDAFYFAQHGHHVHATDLSTGMLTRLQQKLQTFPAKENITFENCSFTQLQFLKNKGPYDSIFSNFGGLNCTGDLTGVLQSFNALVKPGGVVTLVVISTFCLWETLLVLKGKFKTATRRFFCKAGRKAHIEETFFTCWYYAPAFISKQLKNDFDVLAVEGLCTIVPPSYIEHFAEKHPKAFSFLKAKEDALKSKWPWKYIGDYYIITLRKK